MISSDQIMASYYDYRLVTLSVLISILGAYASRDLFERVRDARGLIWLIWLVCGATADGIGTWSMHYTGMMSFILPVPVLYHWPTVLVSLLVGIFGSATALLVLSSNKIGWLRVVVASIFVGSVGISSLHFTGMAAMRLPAMHHYSPALVILSVVLAIVISLIGLSLTFLFRGSSPGHRLRHHGSAWIRGAANPVMHYTAMAGVTYTYSAVIPNLTDDVNIYSLGIAGISVVPVMFLFVVLLTSSVDRVRKQRALLNELFEQAPQAVVLMGHDNRVVRVNREFTQLFGYTGEEAHGRRLSDLIFPNELRDEDQKYANLVAQGQRVEAEGVRLRKDGSRLHVSIVRVPVSLPGGQIATYAIYRDITEGKRAEDQIKATSEQLRALSASLQSAREEEGTRIAREIHDELGGALTSLKWDLESLDKVISESRDQSKLQVLREKIKSMLGLSETTISAVRRISSELRPCVLDDLGLAEAIEWQALQFEARTGITCNCDCSLENISLNEEQSTVAFRILQEALTNILRHAQATRVDIAMKEEPGVFVLTISDNGRGITEDDKSRLQSLGLLGMRERAHLIGAEIDVTGVEGQGTVVTLRVPTLNSDRKDSATK
jgi:PAS domain S-box-containing protein